MRIDKDKIKEQITMDMIYDFLAEHGAEPEMVNDSIISKTICHNGDGNGSRKLYWYENTGLFHCYSGCSEPSFDIFELYIKLKVINDHKEVSLYQAVIAIANYFNLVKNSFIIQEDEDLLDDWAIFNKYNEINELDDYQSVISLNEYDDSILKHLPQPRIQEWEKEGISYKTIQEYEIKYDPTAGSIIIPHRDKNNNLVGIRQRTLVKEQEVWGKYRPAILSGVQYKHPLGFNLYNFNKSYYNISKFKKAIVFESEKAAMAYHTAVGKELDISVAVCGSNLIKYHVEELITAGAEEIVVAFDRDFEEIGDEVWEQQTKKLKEINKKYSKYCNISFIFDLHNRLKPKMSPIDNGIETFNELFKERTYL